MNEALKQFSDAIAKELQLKLEAPEIKDFVEKVKASGDDRTFEVVFSTSDEDRQGDALNQAGWDFKYYQMNPVVLFAHDYSSFPVGIATDLQINGEKSIATGKFAPAGINPQADMACALYQAGILKAVSPGYIQNDDGTRELLEISFCPVPAGRYALSLRQVSELGVSTRDLITKGFFYNEQKTEAKAPQAGDSCETDDGEPGVLAADENNPGEMICVPREQKENKSNENNGDMNNELIKSIEAEHGRHGEAFAKAIDEFSEKCLKSEKAEGSDYDKAIDTFEKAIEGEQGDHLEKCMKAIDENYQLQDQKKSIDEFKTQMQAEQIAHVKCVDKAIEEFKDAFAPKAANDDKQKTIDTFTKSMGDELQRHKAAHMELCKAEMGEGETDEQKAAKAAEEAEKSILIQKLKAITASLEDPTANQTSITTAIASLKDLLGSPQDGEGKEKQAKPLTAPKPKVEASKIHAKNEGELSEFEIFMLSRRILKAVYKASGEGLTRIAKEMKEKFPDRR